MSSAGWVVTSGGSVGVAAPVGKLHASGMIFRSADGKPWRWKMATMFRAAQRWDRGEDLSGLVNWTRLVGGNGWRVFCQTSTRFGPDPISLSPARLQEFARWAAQEGLWLELTVLCDCEQLGMGFDQQKSRLRAVVDAVAGEPNIFVEMYNEPGQNSNGVYQDDMARACGYDQPSNRPVLMATGSSSVLEDADLLVLDYMTEHLARKEDWPVEAGKTGHFLYEGWGADEFNGGWRGAFVPIVSDEPIGFAEVRREWSRDDRPQAAFDGGAGFGVGCAGATFHSDSGAQAQVPGPNQTECARQYFGAMNLLPADVPTGKYCHGGFSNHPLQEIPNGDAGEDAGRTFEHEAYVVVAMPTERWDPQARNGWSITDRAGLQGNVLRLIR